MTLISALLLAALIALPGYLCFRWLAQPVAERAPVHEIVAASLATGTLLVGWLALVLAELGMLRLPLLALLVGLLSAALIAVGRRRGVTATTRLPWTAADSAFVGIALAALILLARPHETILGGTDAGVYSNTGAHIARTGSVLIRDDVTQSLAPTARSQRAQTDTPDAAPGGEDGAIRHLMLRLPEGRFPFADYLRLAGFYVLDLPSGTLTPQFLHLYPVWLGVFGQALGQDQLLYATPLLAWLGAIMAGLTGRRLFGPWVGVVTLLLVSVNGLQIWFARQSLSEALLQCLFCTAVYGWVLAYDQPATGEHTTQRPLAGPLAIAGAALGSVSLAHAQFTFTYAVLVPLALGLWLSGAWRPAHWAFFGSLLAVSLHGGLHILTFSLGYFEGLYHHVLLDAWEARARLAGLLTLAAIGLGLVRWQRDRWLPLLSAPTVGRIAPGIVAAVVGLVFVFAYLIRPGILSDALGSRDALAGYIGAPVPLGPEANLVRLGWYLSPLGIILAGIGAVGMVRRFDMRMVLLLGLAATYGLAFNLASFTHESYIYSLRRFVPIVLPFLCLAAAYAVVIVLPALARRIAPRWPVAATRLAGIAPLALLLLFFVATGRTMVGHREHEGMATQIAAIAAKFQPTDIVIFAGHRDEPHKVATPLRFRHGLDAVVVSTNNPRGDLIDAWVSDQIRQGRTVRLALGNNGGKLQLPSHRLEPRGEISVTIRELERLQAQKPFNIQINMLDYTLYDLLPAGASLLPGPPFRYETGPGDEQTGVVGWYGREVDAGGTPFRWTNGDAMLRIPWPADRGDLRLRVHLSGGLRPATLGDALVEVFIATTQNDRTAPRIGTLTLTPGFATHEIIVPRASLPDQPTGAAILWLRNAAWQPSAHGVAGDARWLGLRLAWLELTTSGA